MDFLSSTYINIDTAWLIFMLLCQSCLAWIKIQKISHKKPKPEYYTWIFKYKILWLVQIVYVYIKYFGGYFFRICLFVSWGESTSSCVRPYSWLWARGSFLTVLCGFLWDARDWTLVGHVQNKPPSLYIIFPAPCFEFWMSKYFFGTQTLCLKVFEGKFSQQNILHLYKI